MISKRGLFLKRFFDIALSLIGIVVFCPVILLAWIVASIDTKSNGFFCQKRIGKNGIPFTLYKIKTMNQSLNSVNHVTIANDPRISNIGAILRKFKIDELPQLFNVLVGQMSFVGPRPDVDGYANKLKGSERLILSVRPGITGPASIKYKSEELILQEKYDPKKYNDEVIWPDKVKINISYIKNWSFYKDLIYIIKTFSL